MSTMNGTKTQEYERIGTFQPDEILPYITAVTGESEREYQGHMVKMSSLRYLTFARKGISCVRCHLKAKFFALEKPAHQKQDRYHFNLYGVDAEGNEVLFTKDHIKPRSKGGKDHISNMQTMCLKCNGQKGNIPLFILAEGEGWQGIYREDGTLIAEGKLVTARDLLDALGYDAVTRHVDEEWLKKRNSLPVRIGRVRFK